MATSHSSSNLSLIDAPTYVFCVERFVVLRFSVAARHSCRQRGTYLIFPPLCLARGASFLHGLFRWQEECYLTLETQQSEPPYSPNGVKMISATAPMRHQISIMLEHVEMIVGDDVLNSSVPIVCLGHARVEGLYLERFCLRVFWPVGTSRDISAKTAIMLHNKHNK